MMDHYLESVETTLKNLNTNETGLMRAEAKSRLQQNGRNALAKAKKKSLVRGKPGKGVSP